MWTRDLGDESPSGESCLPLWGGSDFRQISCGEGVWQRD